MLTCILIAITHTALQSPPTFYSTIFPSFSDNAEFTLDFSIIILPPFVGWVGEREIKTVVEITNLCSKGGNA